MGTRDGETGAGVFRWRGLLAEGGALLRRVVAGVLAVACVALAFTQVGFIGLQFADGSAAYLIVMLLPAALAALLLGTLAGTAMGLLAGSSLYLHSALMPLDYYELMYVTPVTSIVMMGACGLLLGVLLALISRVRTPGRRAFLVALACLAVSAVFSAGFAVSTVVMMAADMLADAGPGQLFGPIAEQARQAALSAGDAGFQLVGDAVIMALACLVGAGCAERGLRLAGGAGLRTIYGTWLSAVVLVVFMVAGTAAYGALTASSLANAAEDMGGEVSYLLGQVKRTADYNGRVFEAVLDAEGDRTDEAMAKLEELTSGGMLASLLEGYAEEDDGLVVVSVGSYLIGSDAARMGQGDELAACLDADVRAAAQRSVREGTLERVVYDGPGAENDLIDFSLPGSSEAFDSLITRQIGYLMAAELDGYQVVMIRPVGMVFSGRGAVMGWVSFSSLVLLLAMFALAWRLLDLMVARRVDVLNTGLERIAQGDLDTRVAPDGTREFVELAKGINGTVDALQGWIAEAETRMDAELATAKAIQESALPRVFPPYPDILRFDVYATMNAAKEVGGDFYDFFLIGDDCTPDAGKLGFIIADVSGKGVPAALFMMKAKTQLRDYMESGMELGEAVENANRQLCEGNDAGMFVTAWAGVLDYATGRIDFVNAGHNPPLLWQSPDRDGGLDGGWCWLTEKSGLPLGLFDGMPYAAHSRECGIGDQLLLYTDGVTESMGADGGLYGEARLEEVVTENYPLHPRALIDAVRRDVAAHAAGAEQSDDITMLALEVGVPPEITATLTVPADVGQLPRVNAFIHTELDRRLCPLRTQNQLDIAVEELFVNVAHYAYPDAPANAPGAVHVSYTYSAEPPSVTIDIVDEGVPYDPLAKPDAVTPDDVMDVPIGGLGILMAKRSVDEMRYERVDGSNVLTIVKKW